MPRRLSLETLEKGKLDVLVIRSQDGVWESEWGLLKGTVVGNLFSQMTQVELDHALHGFSRPFVDALGISPEGALRKMPGRVCRKSETCTFFNQKLCNTLTKKDLPWCYEAAGLDLPPAAMSLVTEAVFRWREGVYLVVVDRKS